MASNFKEVLAQQLKGKEGISGAVGGLASAAGKSIKEKTDLRNILFGGKGTFSQIGQTIFGKGYSALNKDSKVERLSEASSVINQESLNLLQTIADHSIIQTRNSMALRGMSRDMNVMRQNVVKLVKIQGGNARTKADAFFMSSDERARATKSDVDRLTPTKETNTEQPSGGIMGIILAALGLSALAGGIKNMTLGLLKRIPIIGSIVTLITDFFESDVLMEGLGIGKIPALIGTILGGTKGGIMNMFANAGKWAVLGAGIGSVVPGVGTILGGVVGAILGGVMGYFGGDEIASKVDTAMTAVSNLVEDAWDGLKDFGTLIANTIKNLVDSIMASGKSALANVVDKVPGGSNVAKNLRESAAENKANIETRTQQRATDIQTREATKAEERGTETATKATKKEEYQQNLGTAKGVGETGSAKEAIDFFVGKGWTPEQAAGIVGNLQAESGANMKTNAIGDGGKAYGIAQWHPDRQAKFQKLYGKPIQEAGFKEQLEFVNWELNNTEKKAGDMLRAVTGASQAAAVVDKYYERSSGAHLQQRMANATALVQQGSQGAQVAAASSAVSDGQRAASGGTTNHTTNNTVVGGGGKSTPTIIAGSSNPYDDSLARMLMGQLSA